MRGRELRDPGWLSRAAPDGVHLLHAFDQFIEQGLFHEIWVTYEWSIYHVPQQSGLPGGEIGTLVFGVGVEEENLIGGDEPIVDDPAATALAFPLGGHPHLAQAAAAGNDIPGIRAQHQRGLQSIEVVLVEQLCCTGPESRSFNELHDYDTSLT